MGNDLYQIGLPVASLSTVLMNWTCFNRPEKLLISPAKKDDWAVVELRNPGAGRSYHQGCAGGNGKSSTTTCKSRANMKALSALRQVFSLKKNEELGRKFSPEELKRIVDAMKEYAASKLQEQRAICQREFELAYDSGESNLGTNPAITELYVLQSLKESETPELD